MSAPTAPAELLAVAVAAAEEGAEELRRHFRRDDLGVRAKAQHDFVTEADHASEARILRTIFERFPDHRVLAEESGALEGAGQSDGARDRESDRESDGETDGASDRGKDGANDGRGAEAREDVEWIIDPLDGTSNFLHGLPYFCVSIGVRRAGRLAAAVVLEPLSGDRFVASVGGGARWNDRPMRVSARPGLDGAFLATGYPFRAHAALDLYLGAFREVFVQARGIRRAGAAALDLAYTAAGVFDGFFELRLAPWDLAAGILLIREAGGLATDFDGGDEIFRGGNVLAGGAGVHAALRVAVSKHVDEASLDRLEPRNAPGSPAV